MAVLCSKVQAEAGMSIGAQLRASREARGLSIDAVAHTTRVQPRILAAIERDDVRAVPPRPFGRGFVKAYAREIGLDGDQTTRDYFAQFVPVVPAAQPEAEKQPPARVTTGLPRAWRLGLASLGALAAIAIAVVASRPAAKAESSAGVANVVGTSGVTSTSAPASAAKTTDAVPVVPPVSAAATPAAAPVPAAPLTIVLTATMPSWVTADADGRRALFKTVAPGVPETILAKREIVIRVGNAGALAWRINGRELGPMGRIGQIRDVTITPTSAATVK
jgi:cytoskeletal protein RodZ